MKRKPAPSSAYAAVIGAILDQREALCKPPAHVSPPRLRAAWITGALDRWLRILKATK